MGKDPNFDCESLVFIEEEATKLRCSHVIVRPTIRFLCGGH